AGSRLDDCFLAPAKLRAVFKAAIFKDIERTRSADDGCPRWYTSERGQVHMVHVGVREKNQIDAGEVLWIQCRTDNPFAANGGDTKLGTHAVEQHRISENMNAKKV